MQPALRIKKDPARNSSKKRRTSKISGFGTFFSAKKIPQAQGKKSKKIPVG
jgi:hypothetical protein